MSAPTPADTATTEEHLPLPKMLTRIYYIFPIVLYVPDMLFNFYVYSDGVTKFNPSDITSYPLTALWAFLAAGIVGMAWLLSVLAPWHWGRGHKFQSIMCWIGVMIATAITMWSSLAYRSLKFHEFKTDQWITDTLHITISGFSPTMILVAIAPPFWGLFWAIVQPAERKRSAAQQSEDHQMKLERVKQEAEMKRLKAEANARVREAQLKGLASSMKAARAQIGAALSNKEPPAAPVVVTSELPGESITAEVTTLPPAPPLVFSHPDGGSGILHENGDLEQVPAPALAPPLRASDLLRAYSDGERLMQDINAQVEQMRAQGIKVTIKNFAEFRGIELPLAKNLLAKWREWLAAQPQLQEA